MEAEASSYFNTDPKQDWADIAISIHAFLDVKPVSVSTFPETRMKLILS
jgi:hypothetical protein